MPPRPPKPPNPPGAGPLSPPAGRCGNSTLITRQLPVKSGCLTGVACANVADGIAIALLIGIWLIAIGIVRLVGAFEREHRVWHIVLALIEVAAGIVIVASPPIGFATLALLVGISFIANGVGTFALGWMVHSLSHDVEGPAFDAGVTA